MLTLPSYLEFYFLVDCYSRDFAFFKKEGTYNYVPSLKF
jgi:hypothetical protein